MRRVLYFVGAGLTKSLELPSKPVPLMYDYISTMANYLHDDVILTHLAALELEKPYRWNDPEATALAKLITGPARDLSLDNREAFRRALKNKPFESIEDLLQRATSQAATRFIYAISRLFYLVNWDANWCPLEDFLERQFAQENTSHTFISFNYDLILDRAVQKRASGRWDVSTDYGFEIPNCIYNDPPPMPTTGGTLPYINASPLVPSGNSTGQIRILKPHGSLNWLVPLEVPYRSSQSGLVFNDSSVIVALSERGDLRNSYKGDDFQYVCCSGDLPRDLLSCIIPPLAAKHSNLSFINKIRSQISQSIKEANEIYILGWSMPATDDDHRRAIESAINERQDCVEQITVVNRAASPEYFERIACSFAVKVSRLRAFNAGFCEFVAQST